VRRRENTGIGVYFNLFTNKGDNVGVMEEKKKKSYDALQRENWRLVKRNTLQATVIKQKDGVIKHLQTEIVVQISMGLLSMLKANGMVMYLDIDKESK